MIIYAKKAISGGSKKLTYFFTRNVPLVLPLVAESTSLGCAVIRFVLHGGAPNVLSHEAKADVASPRLVPAFPFIWISLYAL